MSTIFSGLRTLFQGRDPEQPQDLSADFKVDLPDEEEPQDIDRSQYIDVDLAGEVFGIEYETPQGALSRRWVSVEGFRKTGDDWSMCAYCFVRKRVRSFPLDSVKALFDADGDPITLSEIFTPGVDAAPHLAKTDGHATIAACRDGLRTLAALARIDGTLHDKEHATIAAYAEKQSDKAGITMNADDKKAVARYIHNLQPTGNLVADCLDRLSTTDLANQKDFFWAAHDVMDADGLQDEAEVKMLLEISEALSHEI